MKDQKKTSVKNRYRHPNQNRFIQYKNWAEYDFIIADLISNIKALISEGWSLTYSLSRLHIDHSNKELRSALKKHPEYIAIRDAYMESTYARKCNSSLLSSK